MTRPPVLPSWTPPPASYGRAYAKPTNGLAIASMITSIVAFVGLCSYGIGAVVVGPVGAILGHVARKQIRERNEDGDGMALAGIIVGWVAVALGVLILAGFVFFIWWAVQNSPNTPAET